MPSPPCSFLQEAPGTLTEEDAALLAAILSPSSHPLPGEPGSGVWRTPSAPIQPLHNISSKIEFGEGLSDVFESLGVECPTTPSPHPPRAQPIHLSATSSPFVPSIPPLSASQTIPIPLPSIPHHQPQTIHINNFTANLNYHGLGQEGQYTTLQQQLYQQQQQQQQQDVQILQQQQAAFQQHVYQQQAFQPVGFPPGYQQPMVGTPLVFVQVPASSYQQMVAPDEEGPPRFTFGSTPVVSIRTHTQSGGENTEEDKTGDGGGNIGEKSKDYHVQAKPKSSVAKPNVAKVQVDKPEVVKPQAVTSEVVKPKTEVEQPKMGDALPSGQSSQSNVSLASKPSQTNNQQKVQVLNEVISQPIIKMESSQPSVPDKSPSDQLQNRINQTKNKPPVTQTSEKVRTSKPQNNEQEYAVCNEQLSVLEYPTPQQQPVLAQQQPSKSWASLFSGKAGSEGGVESGSTKPMAVISPYSSNPQTVSPPTGEVMLDRGDTSRTLGAFLRDYQLKHCSTGLLPRGLTNRSNWCFVNAILQALLACPPLYNLMRTLAMDLTMARKTERVSTPMLDSFTKFMSEFSLLEPVSGTRAQKKDKSKRRVDIVTGVGLEPTCIFNMLLGLQEDTFKVVEGRQEDAEEFLTCLLNGLSDEMQELIKLADEAENGETEDVDDEDEENADDWQEVGAKGKSCVTRRVTGLKSTPVQALALGMCRSCVKVEGKDSSATLQPFYTLQLDIQDPVIKNVTDALLANFANEKLDGFVCGKTKQEVEATRSLSVEELPPVLILHLKRFVYDAATGGVQKIMKAVDFPVDLDISKSVLSAECRNATTAKHRQYKLFSVVCHNGREATKGHYVTDVFHTGYSTWLHCDDGIVQPTAEELVLGPGASSTPYLLFYRRGDTLVGSEKKEP